MEKDEINVPITLFWDLVTVFILSATVASWQPTGAATLAVGGSVWDAVVQQPVPETTTPAQSGRRRVVGKTGHVWKV